MRRHALVSATGGILAALILPLVGGCQSWTESRAPEGSPLPAAITLQPAVPVARASAPYGPPPESAVPASLPLPSTGPGTPLPMTPYSPVPPATTTAPPPTPSKVRGKGDSIECLMSRLDAIRTQKAELEKSEKETVALLREKLRQQEQRLQKLGVHAEEARTRPAPPTPAGVPVPAEPVAPR